MTTSVRTYVSASPLTLSVCALIVAAAGALSPLAASSQDFVLQFEADTDVLAPDDRVTFTLTASNNGSSALSNVAATIALPDQIDSFAESSDFVCLGTTCDAGESANWSIGTLDPGDSRTFIFRTFIHASAPEGALLGQATVSFAGSPDVVDSVALLVDNSRAMRVSVSADSGPAVPDDPFTYTLTVSNLRQSSIVSPLLTFLLPDGASFVSASDSGVLDGSDVTWDLGVFGAGTARELHVTVLPDASLIDGHLLVASASVDPDETNESVARSTHVMPVRADVPLRFEYGISQASVAPDDRLVYEITATNSGDTPLVDVSAAVLLPGFVDSISDDAEFDCLGTTCDQSEFATWTIGTLDPGQTRTVLVTTFVSSLAPGGHILKSTLLGSSTGSGQALASLDASVVVDQRMRLSISPTAGPAEPGEPLEYTLSATNYGPSSIVSPELRFSIPEGATFASATGGGSLQDDDVVWELGPLGSGAGVQFNVVVTPDAGLSDGHLLIARATAAPNETNVVVVRSSTVTPVRGDGPLQIRYGLNRSSVGADDQLIYHVTAVNRGDIELLNVAAVVLLPEFVDSFAETEEFSCLGNTCDRNETAEWTIGTLEPGQSRTVFFESFAAAQVPDGHVFSSRLLATSTGSGQVLSAVDAHADPSPRMRMSLAPTRSPAVPGEMMTYTITLGNIGAANPGTIDLQLELPGGVTATAVSDGGAISDGMVTWSLPPLAAGRGRKLSVDVTVEASLGAGHLLFARASIDPNELNESILRATSVVPTGSTPTVALDYNSNELSYQPNSAIEIDLTATNTGITPILDLTVGVELPLFINSFSESPDLSCIGTTCDQDETAVWTIGSLASGQDVSQDINTSAAALARDGEIMTMRFTVEPTPNEQVIYFSDELIGALANRAPNAVSITSPSDGTSFMLGGTSTEDAGDPAATIEVTWTEASDPDDDVLTYTWQLSTTEDFTDTPLALPSDEATPLQLGVAHGMLATWLDGAGVSPGVATDLHHRVLVSDGENTVASESLTISLVRGTLVGVDAEGIRPVSFSLNENYPNPFADATTIVYDVGSSGLVTIDLFDVRGRLVRTVVNSNHSKGRYSIRVDLSGAASGLYYYRMRSGSFEAIRRMALVRS